MQVIGCIFIWQSKSINISFISIILMLYFTIRFFYCVNVISYIKYILHIPFNFLIYLQNRRNHQLTITCSIQTVNFITESLLRGLRFVLRILLLACSLVRSSIWPDKLPMIFIWHILTFQFILKAVDASIHW